MILFYRFILHLSLFLILLGLDEGYFGKGIYFTCELLYTLPYSVSKKNPAVIVAYIIPGNAFPVTEHHKGDENLMGAPIQNGIIISGS
jgi:hypothetical protein